MCCSSELSLGPVELDGWEKYHHRGCDFTVCVSCRGQRYATVQMKDKLIDAIRVVSPVLKQKHHRTWLGNTDQGRCDEST